MDNHDYIDYMYVATLSNDGPVSIQISLVQTPSIKHYRLCPEL